MKIKKLLLLICTLFITNCSINQAMKPEDFKDQKPRLIIEEYLSGNVKAWGILQNRSGKVQDNSLQILMVSGMGNS